MIDEIFGVAAFYIPRKIDYQATKDLTKGIDLVVVSSIREAQNLGWVFYVTETVRGKCSYRSKNITIPTFAMNRGKTYKNWYISHEIAHIHTKGDIHGARFMAMLLKLCPEDSIHHELGYKPRNASKAGILSCTDF